MRKYFYILIFILIYSCVITDIDPKHKGFNFHIYNETNINYDGELLIGGLKKGKFKAIDSILTLNIIKGSNSPSIFFNGEKRWKDQSIYQLPMHVDAMFDHSLTMIRSEIKWIEKFIIQMEEK